jgi:hypothetical protein
MYLNKFNLKHLPSGPQKPLTFNTLRAFLLPLHCGYTLLLKMLVDEKKEAPFKRLFYVFIQT